MTRTTALRAAAWIAALGLTGCGGAATPEASPSTMPSPSTLPVIEPEGDPACPDEPGGRAVPYEADTGGSDLVSTDPVPVSLTLCTYYPQTTVERDAEGTAGHTWSPPTALIQQGDELRSTVAALNALPPLTDVESRVCSLMLGPAYRLLLSYADGSTTALVLDENCDIVSDEDGAARLGAVDVIRGLQPE
jgi:hypothetical protein